MKKLIKGSTLQYYGVLILLLFAPFMTLLAQQDIKVNGRDVGSWFDRNWMWVAGAVVILLIVALAGRGNRKRKTVTTVMKDDAGNVKSVTTTEVKE